LRGFSPEDRAAASARPGGVEGLKQQAQDGRNSRHSADAADAVAEGPRLDQNFSMRYPLIDGQGNYGSIDGDPAAAYRYTEARLSKVAMELLEDIDKECVDFVANFDDRLQEPTVLPARVPNLLVNGTNGIAVGMATNIPPHNLGEVIDATVHLMRTPDASIDDLIRYIPGPDFPTAGLIFGRSGIEAAYRTGRGSIVMRARMN